MNNLMIVLWLVSLGQITPAIPDGATIFTITYKDGGQDVTVAAAIRARGEFAVAFDRLALPAQLELVRDEPWFNYPSATVLKQNVREAEPESSAKRRLRYENSGFERIESDQGVTWLSAETVARATRMRELEEARDAERARIHSTASLAALSSGGGGDSGPGVFALWGRHVAVLVFAAIGIVITVKIGF